MFQLDTWTSCDLACMHSANLGLCLLCSLRLAMGSADTIPLSVFKCPDKSTHEDIRRFFVADVQRGMELPQLATQVQANLFCEPKPAMDMYAVAQAAWRQSTSAAPRSHHQIHARTRCLDHCFTLVNAQLPYCEVLNPICM